MKLGYHLNKTSDWLQIQSNIRKANNRQIYVQLAFDSMCNDKKKECVGRIDYWGATIAVGEANNRYDKFVLT